MHTDLRWPEPDSTRSELSTTHPALNRIEFPIALVILGLMMGFAAPVAAVPIKLFLDENNSLIYNLYDKKGPQSVPGKFTACNDGAPCDGVKTGDGVNPDIPVTQAWSYALPAAAKATDGDVLITGGGGDGNDLLRFKSNVLYVFSEAGGVELKFKREAGVGPLPAADVSNISNVALSKNAITLKENIKDDANSGAVYKPRQADPGGGPETNEYGFASDGTGGVDVRKFEDEMGSTDPVSSKGHSVHYEAAHQRLSFADDQITDTSFAADPMLDAFVNLSDFLLQSTLFDGTAVFKPESNSMFSISMGSNIFLQASVDALRYDPSSNTFAGTLSGLAFDTGLGSPWIAETDDVFDPLSVDFIPGQVLLFTYTPDSNFLALTQSFTVDGTSSGTNGINVAVPEPSVILLIVTGFMVFGASGMRTFVPVA